MRSVKNMSKLDTRGREKCEKQPRGSFLTLIESIDSMNVQSMFTCVFFFFNVRIHTCFGYFPKCFTSSL